MTRKSPSATGAPSVPVIVVDSECCLINKQAGAQIPPFGNKFGILIKSGGFDKEFGVVTVTVNWA